jgi:hypothetical protein
LQQQSVQRTKFVGAISYKKPLKRNGESAENLTQTWV